MKCEFCGGDAWKKPSQTLSKRGELKKVFCCKAHQVAYANKNAHPDPSARRREAQRILYKKRKDDPAYMERRRTNARISNRKYKAKKKAGRI